MKIRSKEVIELFVDSILDIPIGDAEKHVYMLFPGEDERAVMLEELYRQLALRRNYGIKVKEKVAVRLTPPRVKLKLERKAGVWRVLYKSVSLEFSDFYDVLHYIYIIKLIIGRGAYTVGAVPTCRINTLVPPVTPAKVVRMSLGGVVRFEQEYR